MKTRIIKIHAVRHGQTLLNEIGRIQGWIDSPLTEMGRQEAEICAGSMKDIIFSGVFSSDSGRAIETREIIVQGLDSTPDSICLDKRLREFYFGLAEGEYVHDYWGKKASEYHFKDSTDLLNNTRILYRMDLVNDLSNRVAETMKQFSGRINNFIKDIYDNADDESVYLLITHGIVISYLLENAVPSIQMNLPPPNASVSEFAYDGKNLMNIKQIIP